MKVTLLVFAFLWSSTLGAQRILLLNGTAHIGNGNVLESAAIGVINDRIAFVKNSLTQSFQSKDWDTIFARTSTSMFTSSPICLVGMITFC